MRLLLLSLLPLGFLAGCAEKAYLLDHKISTKASLAAQEMARYGLGEGEARCVGERLGNSLSIWQLRQLIAAGGGAHGETGTARLATRDLLRVASQVRDPEVTLEVAGATASCGVSVSQTATAPSKTVPLEPAMTPPAAPAPAQAPGGAAGSPSDSADEAPAVQNGPLNYQPSEELVSALTASERGDYATAARLAKIAADNKDSGAQQLLGGLYSFGRGVPEDHKIAAQYYRLAAEQGWSEAMNNLGRAYETGQGVPRDHVEALKWYLLASTRTTEDDEMVGRNIKNIVGDMSTDQIERAARLAHDWNRGRGRQ